MFVSMYICFYNMFYSFDFYVLLCFYLCFKFFFVMVLVLFYYCINGVLVFVVLVFYVLIFLGFSSYFESKMLGLLVGSVGVSKYFGSGVVSFVLDFIKLMNKDFWNLDSFLMFKKSFVILFYFIIFINVVLNVVLVFWFLFYCDNIVDFLIGFFFVNIFSVVWKVCLLMFFFVMSGYVFCFSSSLVCFFVCSELSFVLIMSVLFGISLMICHFENFNFLWNMICEFPFIFCLIGLGVLKSSSSPFDFLESESEFVGGGSLEFYGLMFSLWTFFEYSTLVFNSLYIVFVIIGFFINKFIYLICFFVMFFLLVVCSGVFVSFSFYKFNGWCMFYVCILLIFLIIYVLLFCFMFLI